MSDSIIIFIRSNNIPEIDLLREALKNDGLELESWDESSIKDIEGFWPGRYKGKEAGFEFMLDEVDDEDLDDWGIEKEQLDGRDFMLDLAFYTELDVVASALCAAYFCKTCDGITFDDDEELTINAQNCDEWLVNYIIN